MKQPNSNPKVVYLKTPPMNQQQCYIDEQERISCKEYRAPEVHHYETARSEMTPIQFAEYVLKDHRQLYDHHGHTFLDGHYATLARKIEAANAILRRMKLAPIILGRRP